MNESKDLGSRRYPKTGNNSPEQLKTHYCSGKTAYLKLAQLIIILSLINEGWGTEVQTHEPFKWSLIRWEDQKVISTDVTPGAPILKSQVCDLVPTQPCLNRKAIYACPASNPGKSYCNYPGEYYCAYWGCETVSLGFLPGGGQDEYITISWGPSGCTPPTYGTHSGEGTCQHLEIKILKTENTVWWIGKTWGVRMWEPGRDRGGHFLIKKERVPPDPPIGIGPNVVINNNQNKTEAVTVGPTEASPYITEYGTLWKIIQSSFKVLNNTYPELTKECWLCYDIRPPFYEAIGSVAKIRRRNGTNPAECLWKKGRPNVPGITLAHVTGNGVCVGTIPLEKRHLCNKTIEVQSQEKPSDWLLPADNAKWICAKLGVTTCLSTKIFNQTTNYCVQVIIVPRIIYHPKDYVISQQETSEHHLIKREPFTALTVAMLLTIGGAGLGTGVASLINQPQGLKTLRQSVDEDLQKIDEAINALTKSVRSLSEVVLQNRRGLDLLLLQQGGLCVALKEQCCTYVDQTGVAIDTMAELRKQLEQRKRAQESQRSWYESWFNGSSWFTTLLSTIMGPVIMIILGLTFGPCILNRLIVIVKNRLEAAHLMVIRERYEPLDGEPEEDALEWSRQELKRFNEQNKIVQ